MERHCRAATVRVAVLPMRSALPHLLEPEPRQVGRDFTRLQNRNRGHSLRDPNRLKCYELRLEFRLTVLEEHLDDFTEVALKLVQGAALAMCAGPTGNCSNVKARVWVSLHDDAKASHISTPYQPASVVLRLLFDKAQQSCSCGALNCCQLAGYSCRRTLKLSCVR